MGHVDRLIIFGDPAGVGQLLECGGMALREKVVAVVGAQMRKYQHDELRQIAMSGNWLFLTQPKLSHGEYPRFIEKLKSFSPDLLLINSYSMILGPDILKISANGAINIHGAPLPECRGANPVEWALIEERWLAGVTVHAVDEGIDTGPIIRRCDVPVTFVDTWRDVRRRVSTATQDLLIEILPCILTGSLDIVPQDENRATYYRRRRPKDGRFEWDWPVRKIYNMIRALVSPHPGTSADCGGTVRNFCQFLSIGEVAKLKFSKDCGNRTFESNGLILDAIQNVSVAGHENSETGDDIAMTFRSSSVEDFVYTAEVQPLDWRSGRAVGVTRTGASNVPAFRSAIRAFAAQELGLTKITFKTVPE